VIIDLDVLVKMFIMHGMWKIGEAGRNDDSWPMGASGVSVQSAYLAESCLTTEHEVAADLASWEMDSTAASSLATHASKG
jgi:hypothetical protein